MLDKNAQQLFLVEDTTPAAESIWLAPKAPAPEWADHEAEGQLSVDILETKDDLVVVAPMAGTMPSAIELHLQNDCLTIRGTRLPPVTEAARYFYEECYWGKFSRTIVLPVDVRIELAESEYKHGVLTIRLPKVSAPSTIPIHVVEE